MGKLQSLKYEKFSKLSNSSDISPIDYYVFKHFEIFIRDKIFSNIESKVEAFERFICEKDYYNHIK